jgi:hypothetical protein
VTDDLTGRLADLDARLTSLLHTVRRTRARAQRDSASAPVDRALPDGEPPSDHHRRGSG